MFFHSRKPRPPILNWPFIIWTELVLTLCSTWAWFTISFPAVPPPQPQFLMPKFSLFFFSFNFVSSLPFFFVLFVPSPCRMVYSSINTTPTTTRCNRPIKEKGGEKKTKHLVHLLSSSFFVMSVQNKPTHLFFSSGNTPPLKKMVDSSGVFFKFFFTIVVSSNLPRVPPCFYFILFFLNRETQM